MTTDDGSGNLVSGDESDAVETDESGRIPEQPSAEAEAQIAEPAAVADHVGDSRAAIGETMREFDCGAILEKLAQCGDLRSFFEKIRDEVNLSLETVPEFNDTLGELLESACNAGSREEAKGTVLKAVRTNDFDVLDYPKTSSEYTLALSLTAIKNRFMVFVTEQALREYGEKLGFSQAEQQFIAQYLGLIPYVDRIYTKWRTSLYPPELTAKLREVDDPHEYLEGQELDDPYAVVQAGAGGAYANVPYAVLFAEEYGPLLEKIDEMIALLRADAEHAGGKLNHATTLAYLEAYRAALGCTESRKEGGEWLSVKLWKEVDRRWLKCQDAIQFIHGIESGYEVSVDPAELRVIPEIKMAVQSTPPEVEELIRTMKTEGAGVLGGLITERLGAERAGDALHTLELFKKSHVGIVTVMGGGGNSMDAMGVAQMGPNYEDIQGTEGAKAYVSARDDGERVRDDIARNVFRGGDFDRDWVLDAGDARRNYLSADFIGGHELGHLFLGEVEQIEELKATWVAMVALYEREKAGTLPRGTAEVSLRSHVKYCLKYLLEDEGDDYGNEGIANIKIFLDTGVLTKSDIGAGGAGGGAGGYEFHPERIEDFYETVKRLFLTFVELYSDPERETDGSEAQTAYEEWVAELIDAGEHADSIAELKALAEEGKR